jgi:hypothetical protein
MGKDMKEIYKTLIIIISLPLFLYISWKSNIFYYEKMGFIRRE